MADSLSTTIYKTDRTCMVFYYLHVVMNYKFKRGLRHFYQMYLPIAVTTHMI